MSFRLTRAQAVYLMFLAGMVRRRLARGETPGVTVREFAIELNISESRARGILNELGRLRLISARTQVPGLYGPGTDLREKLWEPNFDVGEEGVKKFLESFPEILGYIDRKTLEKMLDMKLEQ